MRKVRRRKFLLASSALLAAPLASFAQPAQKVRRIGFLTLRSASADWKQLYREPLRRAGYEEGGNLIVEWRFADGNLERLAELAGELVRLNVELIVAVLNEATDAARRATKTIPIVMVANMFPVERGIIKSLARPGGNVTGMVWYADPPQSLFKMLQIIKDAVPKATRVAWLGNSKDPQSRFYDPALLEQRAAGIGLSVQRFDMTRPDDEKAVLGRIASSRPDALWVGGNVSAVGSLENIAAFASERKLASISDNGLYVRAGGLLTYGPDIGTIVERNASYVDRILRGAKPGELPVEQTTKWELILNAKTARTINFNPSQSFLAAVDRRIE